MKRPNNLFQKKYISSLVIAAFLILSVLTAYNIRTGKEAPETANTETTETAGESDDVIGPVSEYTQDKDSGDDAKDADDDIDDGGDSEEAGNEDDEDADDDDENDGDNDADGDDADDDEDDGGIDQGKDENDNADGGETYTYNGKTKLSWPVVGNIILPYSMDATVYYTTLDQYACNDGIIIGANVGDKVKAPADGRVVNIMDSGKYGKSVTILIGQYYEVTCAQLTGLNFEIGDDVKEGDVLGTVAEPTRAFALEGPNVFFRMTYKSKPVNPVKYLRT